MNFLIETPEIEGRIIYNMYSRSKDHNSFEFYKVLEEIGHLEEDIIIQFRAPMVLGDIQPEEIEIQTENVNFENNNSQNVELFIDNPEISENKVIKDSLPLQSHQELPDSSPVRHGGSVEILEASTSAFCPSTPAKKTLNWEISVSISF